MRLEFKYINEKVRLFVYTQDSFDIISFDLRFFSHFSMYDITVMMMALDCDNM